VVAAGSGRRFGAVKQFSALGGERVVDRSVRIAAGSCDGVVVVVPEDALGGPDGEVPLADVVVGGGATRTESSRAGVGAVPFGAGVILVHDAARPLVGAEVFERVIEAVRAGAQAVVPVVEVVDTIRDVDRCVVDRGRLRAVQTPQGFSAAVIRDALEAGVQATDDAGAVEAIGHEVQMVPGDPDNRKITTPADLLFARTVIGESEPGAIIDRQEAHVDLRVGNGFDIHVFSDDPDRKLVLGGVCFEGHAGLEGNSDADVVTHAVAEALLGAAVLGDLGSHFPDDDDRYRGADSLELLRMVVQEVTAAGWMIANVDCSVIAERPKLAAHRDVMQKNLAGVVGAPVSVKGRRAEGLGALGRSEGIAAMVSALLVRNGEAIR
jgi:2-C-methyl-D-erythritol 4-phosphate cytidylyltransferase/2-C-methyl-D-erythritol 2,4-cyclodiphosphate synthase